MHKAMTFWTWSCNLKGETVRVAFHKGKPELQKVQPLGPFGRKYYRHFNGTGWYRAADFSDRHVAFTHPRFWTNTPRQDSKDETCIEFPYSEGSRKNGYRHQVVKGDVAVYVSWSTFHGPSKD